MSNNPVYNSIVEGLNQGIDFAKGNLTNVKRRKVQIAPLPDFDNYKIRAIRNDLNLSQTIFAAALGVSIKTVEAWESGKNKPNGSAIRILQLLEKDHNFLETYNIISV